MFSKKNVLPKIFTLSLLLRMYNNIEKCKQIARFDKLLVSWLTILVKNCVITSKMCFFLHKFTSCELFEMYNIFEVSNSIYLQFFQFHR